MTDEEIHNIYLHMSGKAEGLVEANGTADFPVLFARAILEYDRLTKDAQNMASKFTHKEQLETKDEFVGKFAKFTDGIWREVTDYSAGISLYTTPQGCDECGVGGGYALYCLACAEKYVKPEWIGLTHEEISVEWFAVFDAEPGIGKNITNGVFDFANAIEAKLKEKNT